MVVSKAIGVGSAGRGASYVARSDAEARIFAEDCPLVFQTRAVKEQRGLRSRRAQLRGPAVECRTGTKTSRSLTMPIPRVTLYSRPGCHLCEVVKEQLETIRREMDFHIEERNIDEEASWREQYNDDIPVVAVNGLEICKHRLDAGRFRDALSSGTRGTPAADS